MGRPTRRSGWWSGSAPGRSVRGPRRAATQRLLPHRRPQDRSRDDAALHGGHDRGEERKAPDRGGRGSASMRSGWPAVSCRQPMLTDRFARGDRVTRSSCTAPRRARPPRSRTSRTCSPSAASSSRTSGDRGRGDRRTPARRTRGPGGPARPRRDRAALRRRGRLDRRGPQRCVARPGPGEATVARPEGGVPPPPGGGTAIGAARVAGRQAPQRAVDPGGRRHRR